MIKWNHSILHEVTALVAPEVIDRPTTVDLVKNITKRINKHSYLQGQAIYDKKIGNLDLG